MKVWHHVYFLTVHLFHLSFRGLKHEAKSCMDDLRCNVVVMKRSKAKVLRLNLTGSANLEQEAMACSSIEVDLFSTNPNLLEYETMIKGPTVTPASSPDHEHEQESPLTATDVGTSSISSSDPGNSPYFGSGIHQKLKKENYSGEEIIILKHEHCGSESDVESESLGSGSAAPDFSSWIKDVVGSCDAGELSKGLMEESIQKPNYKSFFSECNELLDELSKFDREPSHLSRRSLGQVIPSISRSTPLKPPPLCSVCQHKAPVFGDPPRWFSYSNLELATDGFSQENFLAEGGYGSVHRGVLADSQVVAVKQHKLASSQGDREFCSEVEVLSCAQHRNLVTLIGFCVEDGRRLLVYEYVCNGSLDSHLYGNYYPFLKLQECFWFLITLWLNYKYVLFPAWFRWYPSTCAGFEWRSAAYFCMLFGFLDVLLSYIVA